MKAGVIGLGLANSGGCGLSAVALERCRYWHKADMLNALTNVRFWGQSGH